MLAEAASSYSWPDGIDFTITLAYIGLMLGVLVAGYACMVLDIRAYYRSLRRALVLISHYRVELPAWVRRDTPRCIQALGLKMPCSTEEVLDAYRQKVKVMHPDRGGNRQDFLKLQQYFEQAMALLQDP